MTINWKYTGCLLVIATCSTLCFSCFQSDYTKLVKAELAKDVRKDSVLLGIHLGDTRNVFYGKCFDLNKQKLITPGSGTRSVQYFFTDSLFHDRPTEVRLLFYPTFDDKDVIAEMRMEFSYTGWSPWNRPLQSDSLKVKVMKMLMNWYKGNPFVNAHVNERDMPVKVDGNRRIILFVKDQQAVDVKVQDLLHPYFRHSITEAKE